MIPPPQRPWWKRKRRIAAAIAILFLIAYPASFGPLVYLNLRGWLPGRYWLGLYKPLDRIAGESGLGESTGYYDYCRWWGELAKRHRTASE